MARILLKTGAVAAVLALAAAGPVRATGDAGRYLLIDRMLDALEITDVVIDDRDITYRDRTDTAQRLPLENCIGLVRSAPAAPDAAGLPRRLVLSDGQRIPGRLDTHAPHQRDVLAWSHPWLGTIETPLDHVAAVTFRDGQPVPVPGSADVVVLRNGDRLEGFVTAIADPIAIDVGLDDASQRVDIPVARAASAALISPRRPITGRRIWFRDGTTIDARSLGVGDDGFVRLSTAWTDRSEQPMQVRLEDIDAILFDARSMIPLGRLEPARVETSAVRYVLEPPRVPDVAAPLGLGRIVCRGPIVVRYALPPGCRRFAAEAALPEAARVWGDYELIVRDDEEEVYRERLNADAPRQTINVPLRGSELTIELTQGANGPIQDDLVLARAMLLVQSGR
jgi:hypothetical protein